MHCLNRTVCLLQVVCWLLMSAAGSLQAADAPRERQSLDGLWSGSWGGGPMGDGVVFQPVIAELMIDGDQIELRGFHNMTNLAGKVRVEAKDARIYVTSSESKAEAGGKKPEIPFDYQLKDDKLRLTDGDKFEISLQRISAAQDAPVNVQLELVAATGINDAGDLLITEYTALRASRSGKEYRQANARALKTKDSKVAVVQQSGVKQIDISEARKLLGKGAEVAIVYRGEKAAVVAGAHELFTGVGAPAPDSDAALNTISKSIRPGTLVFILAAKENIVLP